MLVRKGEFAGGNITISTTHSCVASLLIIGDLVCRRWLLLLSFAGAVVDLLRMPFLLNVLGVLLPTAKVVGQVACFPIILHISSKFSFEFSLFCLHLH